MSLTVLTLVAALAGCSSPRTDDKQPDNLDQSIRSFDFKNALWLDYPVDEAPALLQLKLEDGKFLGSINSPSSHGEIHTYELSGSPVFADVDGDGDEDAALALQSADQGGLLSWYIWIWQDGSAQQLHYPFYRHSRCDAGETEVHPAEAGFRVSTFLKSRQAACAEPPTKSYQYVVGLRDSYPVRVRPIPGAPDKDCFAEGMKEAAVRSPVTARVAPEEAAPEIEEAKVYDRVEVFATGQNFLLARLTTSGQTSCGWVRRSAITDRETLEE
ncbi:hypothetical protein CA850_11360 [Micromonospora echinospora]|nr:hypothetical protein CA850_11360 [Micromonospora echinospora]